MNIFQQSLVFYIHHYVRSIEKNLGKTTGEEDTQAPLLLNAMDSGLCGLSPTEVILWAVPELENSQGRKESAVNVFLRCSLPRMRMRSVDWRLSSQKITFVFHY